MDGRRADLADGDAEARGAVASGWAAALRGLAQSGAIVLAFVGFGLAWSALAAGSRADAYNVGIMLPSHPATGDGLGSPSLWLVDGFNVLHVGILRGRERGSWWRDDERRKLLRRAASFQERGAQVWVVFDGPRPRPEEEETDEMPRVVFARSADEWLLRRVREAEDPARVAVVTADRRLAARARHRGARVVAPAAFLERCGA